MTILYTAHATSSGGRTGEAKTDDGRLSVTLDTVKEFGGAGGRAPTRSNCSRPAIPPVSTRR